MTARGPCDRAPHCQSEPRRPAPRLRRSGHRPSCAGRGALPADAQATALLHDLLELCPYGVYLRGIAQAPGPAGRLARIVKLADVDDHLAHRTIPSDAPPYAWARKQLLATAKNGVTCRTSVG